VVDLGLGGGSGRHDGMWVTQPSKLIWEAVQKGARGSKKYHSGGTPMRERKDRGKDAGKKQKKEEKSRGKSLEPFPDRATPLSIRLDLHSTLTNHQW
jgi:hypothetical protein